MLEAMQYALRPVKYKLLYYQMFVQQVNHRWVASCVETLLNKQKSTELRLSLFFSEQIGLKECFMNS